MKDFDPIRVETKQPLAAITSLHLPPPSQGPGRDQRMYANEKLILYWAIVFFSWGNWHALVSLVFLKFGKQVQSITYTHHAYSEENTSWEDKQSITYTHHAYSDMRRQAENIPKHSSDGIVQRKLSINYMRTNMLHQKDTNGQIKHIPGYLLILYTRLT